MGSLGGISPGGSIALGILVGLLSTGVQSTGLTLQRKSHMLEDEKGPHEIRPPHRRRRWQLGMAMFVIANILGSTVQISTLPLPVLSTLQASGLVFNSILATLVLGEPFTRWSLYGTCLVCTGAVLIAIFGAIPAPTHSLDELLDLLSRRTFVVWIIITGLVVVAISVTIELINFLTNLSHDPHYRLVRGLAYGCISGILSAHALLVAKSAVELIIKTVVDKNNQFTRWQSWVLVCALVILALSQLYYLHRGLKLVSTSVLYPLVFCVYNIIAILDGLIYFHQTSLITPLRGGLIALGTVVLLSGVLALSWRLSEEQHPPAVGQGSLAPGLGLVEDTEGEEDMDFIDSDLFSDEDEAQPLLLQGDGYDTFSASTNGASVVGSLSGKKKKKKPRWQETREIWGELDDRDADDSLEGAGGLLTRGNGHSRQRSLTLPIFRETSGTLEETGSGRHSVTPLTPGPGSSQEGFGIGPPTGSRKLMFRRRRKSLGFPGFIARKTTSRRGSFGGGTGSRNTSGGINSVASFGSVSSPFRDAVNGVLKLGFWKKPSEPEERDPEVGLVDANTCLDSNTNMMEGRSHKCDRSLNSTSSSDSASRSRGRADEMEIEIEEGIIQGLGIRERRQELKPSLVTARCASGQNENGENKAHGNKQESSKRVGEGNLQYNRNQGEGGHDGG